MEIMQGENTHNLLIDFNSPLQGKLNRTCGELMPLVPSPDTVNTTVVINEADNNPFDFVDNQTNLDVRIRNDPFELAYYLPGKRDRVTAADEPVKDDISNVKSVTDLSQQNDNASDSNSHENIDSLEILNERICDRKESSVILIEDVTDPGIEVCVSFSDISPIKKVSPLEGVEKDENNYSIFCTDLTTEEIDNSEEAIKAVVANRVNACIQNALHQSKLYYDSFTFNPDSNEHPPIYSTSCLHTSFSPKHSRNKMNILANKESLYPTYEHPTVLKYNYNTPKKNISFVESHGRFSLPNWKIKPESNSTHEMLKVSSPYLRSKPDLLECVGNSELKNSSCFKALWNSNLAEKQTKFLADRNHEVNTGDSNKIVDIEGFSEVPAKNKKEKGDDSVFLEAHNVAFMFRSFSHLSASDGEEEDILTCKPEWEKSILNLPKFNSEEDETDCKLGSSTASILKNDKGISKEGKAAFTPPDIVVPIVLPMVEKSDVNIRIKSKQQIGKKGPIKAIVPFGNLARAAAVEEKEYSLNNDGSSNSSFKPGNYGKCQRGSQYGASSIVKPMESKSTIHKGFSLTSHTSTSTAKITNSTTGRIPLISPSVSLKNKYMRDAQTLNSQHSSKSSSSPSHFNLSGLVATSTPARKISGSAGRSLLKTMPSPILVKDKEKKSIPTETSVKNRSFDGQVQEQKYKTLPNKPHSRSKSASFAHSIQFSQSQKENLPQTPAKMTSILSTKYSSHTNVQTGVLKPLKMNGQTVSSRRNIVGATQSRKSTTVQQYPNFKRKSLLVMNKENVKPL